MAVDLIRLELTVDPMNLGYAPLAAAGSHNQIAAAINEPRYPHLGKVGITPVLIWIAQWGIMARLRAGMTSSDAQLASIAEVAMMLVSNPNISEIDLGLLQVQSMLDALVAASIIPTEAHADLLRVASVERSRAWVLMGRDVTVDEVSKALEG